jgi:hypothetical protein
MNVLQQNSNHIPSDKIIITDMDHNSLRHISIMFLQCGYSGTQVLDGNVIIVLNATVAGTYGIRMVIFGFRQ